MRSSRNRICRDRPARARRMSCAHSLGIETTTLGFIAGFTGNKIKEEIEKYNIKTDKTLLFCLFLRL